MPINDTNLQIGDSCCVVKHSESKLAALLFDKVFLSRELVGIHNIPKEICFIDNDLEERATDIMDRYVLHAVRDEVPAIIGSSDTYADQIYVNSILLSAKHFKIPITPLFESGSSIDNTFLKGSSAVFQASFEKMPVVINDKLDWEQVLEFRNDKKSLKEYRDFRIWMSLLPQDISVSGASDLIEQKLEDYESALHKHGIQTRLGVYSSLFELKDTLPVLLAGFATHSMTDNSFYTALVAGSVILGKLLVHGQSRKLALSEVQKNNREIALIQSIKSTVDGS